MMNFWKRLRFYLIGVSIGVVLVIILFGPRSMQCSYFPNSRALEEAKIYPMSYSENAKQTIKNEQLDSVFIYNELFKKSKITNFGTDEVRETPCRTYRAQYREERNFDFVYQICKKQTILTELQKLDKVEEEK